LIVSLRSSRLAALNPEKFVANIPADLLYTPEHEYVRRTKDPAVVEIGITDYAQGELGDIVFVELPKAGARFDRMGVFGTVEAVKAVSELFCPVAGEVVEANGALDGDPATINRDPYGAGWMIRLRLSNPAELNELLKADAYEAKIGG
jgi:glycine cleavage system H protein